MKKPKSYKALRYKILAGFTVVLIFGSYRNVNAQDFQIWLDGIFDKKFGDSWEYKAKFGTKRQVQIQGWSDIYLVNTVVWKLKPWYNPEFGLEFHETINPLSSDIREIRPWLGQRFILPRYFHRVHLDQPYFYMRLDQRFLFYPEEAEFDAKTRLRLRLGGRFRVSNRFIKEDVLYIPFLFEGFFNFQGHAIETYASTVRASAGLGFIVSEKLRLELLYWAKGSKNTAGDQATNISNIVNLQLKYYLE